MKAQELKSNMILLLAAAIWGFAFVAQRIGANYLGSFTFNGIRFALGSLSLIPLIIYFESKKTKNGQNSKVSKKDINNIKEMEKAKTSKKSTIIAGISAGIILFAAASLQQIGLVDSSAGKAAFITGLYLVIVPLLGIFLKQYIRVTTWIGIFMAIGGLYFLCVTDSMTISQSDFILVLGAFFWAVHILLIDHFVKKIDALKLSFCQFITCSALSMIAALIFEHITLDGIIKAIVPILYGGVCSVGVAYTLQAVGQKHARPSHAAIVLSMESVFASIGGWSILKENLGFRGYIGCALMMCGMLMAQVQNFWKSSTEVINKVN